MTLHDYLRHALSIGGSVTSQVEIKAGRYHMTIRYPDGALLYEETLTRAKHSMAWRLYLRSIVDRTRVRPKPQRVRRPQSIRKAARSPVRGANWRDLVRETLGPALRRVYRATRDDPRTFRLAVRDIDGISEYTLTSGEGRPFALGITPANVSVLVLAALGKILADLRNEHTPAEAA